MNVRSLCAAISALALIVAVPAAATPGGGLWVSLCTADGAVMRMIPAGPDDEGPDRSSAACHGPCTLARKPGRGR